MNINNPILSQIRPSTRLYVLRMALIKGEIEIFWNFANQMVSQKLVSLTEVERLHNEYY